MYQGFLSVWKFFSPSALATHSKLMVTMPTAQCGSSQFSCCITYTITSVVVSSLPYCTHCLTVLTACCLNPNACCLNPLTACCLNLTACCLNPLTACCLNPLTACCLNPYITRDEVLPMHVWIDACMP